MTTPNLINMLANPTSYNPVTGKVTIMATVPSGVTSVDNEGTGLGLVNNTDPEHPKIKSLLYGVNSISGEEANIYRIERNEPVGNNLGYAQVNNDNSIMIQQRDDTTDNILYMHDISIDNNRNLLYCENFTTDEIGRLNLTTNLCDIDISNPTNESSQLITPTQIINQNEDITGQRLSRAVINNAGVDDYIINGVTSDIGYKRVGLTTPLDEPFAKIGTNISLQDYNIEVANDKFYLNGIASSSGTNDKLLTFNSITGEFNFDDLTHGNENIYNIDGNIVDSIRTVTLDGNILNFTGDNVSSEFNVVANEINLNSNSNEIIINNSGIILKTVGTNDITLQSINDLNLEGIANLKMINLPNASSPGNNVLFYDPASDIVTYNPVPSDAITKTNAGVNTSLFASTVTNDDISLKTLIAGTGIGISNNATDITFTSTVSKTSSGAGQTLFNNTTTDNNVNLKSLVAGTNITLTSNANEITITGASSTNIYNTNGSISAARTVTTNNNLTFSGSANFNVTTNQINLTSATITMPTLPSATQANILYYNTVGGGLSYGLAPGGSSVQSIFKVNLTPGYVIPYSGGLIYKTIPANLPGSTISTDGTSRTWNNSGGNLNLATGVYTAPASFYAIMSINAQINTTVVINLYFRFRRTSGGALNLAESTFLLDSAPAINQYINFRETVYLESGATYVYQLANTDNVGTVAATTLHLTLDRLT